MPKLPKKIEKYVKKKRPASSYGNKGTPFYNSQRWRKCSKQHRVNRPICEVCESRASRFTDHIIRLIFDDRGQPTLEGGAAYDKRNHMSMCTKCHNKKRGKEAHGFSVARSHTIWGYIPQDREEIRVALNA